jgi:hypothetical protein
MKNQIKVLVLALVFLATSNLVSAQSVKSIFEHSWSGSSVQDGVTLTKSGKIYVSQAIKFTISSDNGIAGNLSSTFTIDGADYTRRASIKGTYYPDEQKVFLTHSYEISSETLPYGLYWCATEGFLQIGKSSSRSGYYVLKGTMHGIGSGCSFDSELNLSDY